MTFRTKAIVLRSMPWPKQARFFVLFTPEYGKISGVARGAQKVQSKVAGHLPAFGISEVMVARGRNVDYVAQARLEQRYSALSEQYNLYVLASYVLEVVERLSKEGIGDRLLWDEVQDVLRELNDQGPWAAAGAQARLNLVVRQFAFRVLDRLGYRPELRACVSCGRAPQAGTLFFSVLQSGLLCGNCFPDHVEGQPVSESCIKLLRATLDRPVSQASRLVCADQDAALAATLIDQLVAMHLHEPLRSTRYFV